MDDELRKHFADLMATMEGVASDARAAASTSRETAATVRKLDSRVGVVEGQVQVLHKHVFGSEPPPPSPMRPIAESVGDHEGDLATLAGQMIAAHAKIDRVEEKTDRQTAILERLDKIAANPMVRRVAYAVGVIILGYATAKGLVLK